MTKNIYKLFSVPKNKTPPHRYGLGAEAAKDVKTRTEEIPAASSTYR